MCLQILRIEQTFREGTLVHVDLIETGSNSLITSYLYKVFNYRSLP